MAKTRDQKRIERKTRKARMRAQQYAESAARKAAKGGKKKSVHRPRKVNGYNHGFADARQRQKKNEAQERNRACKALPLDERLELIASRRGKSEREVARLVALQTA